MPAPLRSTRLTMTAQVFVTRQFPEAGLDVLLCCNTLTMGSEKHMQVLVAVAQKPLM